jgi:hypothetical protein
MKFKGKIIQIITEEKSKGYGFRKMPNYDYFNIVELNLWKHQQETRHKLASKIISYSMFIGIILIIIELILILGFNYNFPKLIQWIPWILILVPIILALVYNYFWDRKNRKLWFFDFPIPIEKPHNFILNDEVEINLEIKKNDN